MTELFSWLPTGGWERLAADALWQSTALAGAGLAAAWFFRRRAAMRAAILLAAAILSLTVPLLSCVVRATGTGVLPQPVAAQLPKKVAAPRAASDTPRATNPAFVENIAPNSRSNADAAGAQSAPATGSAAPVILLRPVGADSVGDATVKKQTTAAAIPGRPAPVRLWPWLAGAWVAVSSMLTLRLLRGLVTVRRWIRVAEPCHDPAILAALARASAAVSVRPPEVFCCPAFDTPALVALGRPRLLVPPAMAAEVDWFAIFCHELAHLARRDGASRLAVELCVTLLPWQPLLWIVRSRFRAACEEACDDWAVAGGADPLELAALLLALVPIRRPALALGMAESRTTTRRRILRLATMKRVSSPRLGRLAAALGWALSVVMAVLLAVMQLAGTGPSFLRPGSSAARSEPPWGKEPLAEAIGRAAATLPRTPARPAPYIIEPPDMLQISIVKLVPRNPYRIEAGDKLQIHVANALIDQPISGIYPVGIDGEISLGPAYGNIEVSGLTLAEVRQAIEEQLRRCLRDPQIAVTLAEISSLPPITGERLVGPDGTVNLGTYGIVYVAGKTIGQATDAIESQLGKNLDHPQVSLDVYAYNSKTYFLVIEEPQGDQIVRVPLTGSETVLDALAKGLADRKISDPADYWVWVTRPSTSHSARPTLEPASRRSVLASIDGVVDEVLVKQGQFVKQGEVLARLSNRELEKSIAETSDELAETQKKLRDYDPKSAEGMPENLKPLFRKEPPGAVSVEPSPTETTDEVVVEPAPSAGPAPEPPVPDDIDAALAEPGAVVVELSTEDSEPNPADLPMIEPSLKETLKSLERKRERLTVTSPVDGQVMTPHLAERLLHKSVRRGETLLTIGEAAEGEELANQTPEERPPAAAAAPNSEGKGMPEPAVTRDVFAALDGVVAELPVKHGQLVKQGDVLAVLRNPDLEASVIEMRGKLMSTQKQISSARSLENRAKHGEDVHQIQAEITRLREESESYKKQLAVLENKKEQLVVTSPIDGQISTWELQELLLHRPVRQGQVLMTIAESTGDGSDHILPVDWQRVVEGTNTTSNWRLMPGDRIFVRRKPGH